MVLLEAPNGVIGASISVAKGPNEFFWDEI
jgi:hypothetical protein